MKFENFLKRSNGNEIEAARALFVALRDERGIHLRFEALPNLFEIGSKSNQEGFRAMPELIRHYAMTHDLKHPEEIIDHLDINGLRVSCKDYLKSKPLDAHVIDAKRTIRDLQTRKIMDPHKEVYASVRDYYTYLSQNGINLTESKFQDTLNSKLMQRLDNLEKIADLVIDFNLFVCLCPPGWTNAHPEYSRISVGKIWYDDPGRVIETKLIDNCIFKNVKKISHGLCTECNKLMEKE